ncbi:hypothetical protein GCM10009737_08580 [Nocardioides lentus]|uniref:Uncharacterized protein n=1 Tax=Nocardioides lentus TaxID=338077 RepID=A0ABP5ACK8_9ACTN
MADQPVTAWTIARGIILAVVVIVAVVFVGGAIVGGISSRQDADRRDRIACEQENDRWRERGVPERVRDCDEL